MEKTIHYQSGNILAYTDVGDENGFPILIQHGLIASIKDYYLFNRLINLGTRPISIARPGYGRSSPYVMKNMAEWGDIVSVLVDALKLSQFDVLGMSSGAPYSYSIGCKIPDKCRNIFIFSGIPALYDDAVLAHWPFPVDKSADIPALKKLARELFFSNLSQEGLLRNDIQDSMMNDCFGIAQDLKIRCLDWGFRLPDVKKFVLMQHSKEDNLIMAEMTAKLLPNCRLEIRESGEHFSEELLDDFIKTSMAKHYERTIS